MRYFNLALATLFAALFFAMQIWPGQFTEIRFLTAEIRLPLSSLTLLSYGLGLMTGVFAALFLAGLKRSRSALVSSNEEQAVRT